MAAMKRPRAPLHPPGGRATDSVLPGDLVRALAWLRQRLDQPVHIETLAEVAGVRPRTLESHFRTFLGTTPLGWVRRTRLHNARRALLDSGDRSVTEAALASGFGQLGRFAAYYRAEFGELPSETLQRIRTADPELDDEALRLTWRALPAALHVAPGGCEAALEDLDRAQSRAPGFGLAKALAAWCWGQRAAQHFSATPDADRARARRLAQEAEALAPDNALALTWCSGALVLVHEVEAADRLIERALAIDPIPLAITRRASASAGLCKIRRQFPRSGRMTAMKRPRAPLHPPGGRTTDSVLPGDLVRALAWLRQRLDQPVHIETLAEVAGVRPRTLESHFRTFLGTTPLGWVRRTRLHNARRALLDSGNRSVTEAALANGFGQLGRFAAYYRAEFGELPSETLQRVRAADPSSTTRRCG